MSKSDPFIEEFAPVPNSGYSDSQSPRAHRDSTNETDALAKGSVQDSARYGQRLLPENASASKVQSDLGIESINKRADRVR